MTLTDTLSGTEPPLPAVGVENSVYLQVQSDGRVLSWTKRNGTWRPLGGVGTIVAFLVLDFTGTTMSFLNSSSIWKSTGDSNDPVTHPYTASNSGIIVKDANNAEVFRLWASDPLSTNDNGGNTFIGETAGETNTTGKRNTAVGYRSMNVVTTGSFNTSLGVHAGSSYNTGSNNTCVGDSADTIGEFSNVTIVGTGALAGGDGSIAIGYSAQANGVNSVAIGQSSRAADDNTITLGNQSITDIYCGLQSNTHNVNATVHANAFIGDGFGLTDLDSNAIIFPDSDPHVNGAGYWSGGVLTRSSG